MRAKVILGTLALIVLSWMNLYTANAQTCPSDAYWKFDEGSGGTAIDSIGTDHGTIYGATWSTGKVGGALSFDGSQDYVTVPASDSWNFGSGNFTIDYWVYPTEAIGDWEGHVSIWPDSGESNSFFVRRNPAGKLESYLSPDGGLWGASASKHLSTQTISTGEWHHIAVVRNGNTILGWLDGVQVTWSSGGTHSGIVYYNNRPLIIGSLYPSGSYKPFEGYIDELSISKRALTSEEIQQHYQNGLNGFGYCQDREMYSCTGFEPPLDNGPVTVKKNRALPLKAQLFDSDGIPVTDVGIVALPVIQVLYDSGMGGDAVDVTVDALPAGQGTEGNQFVFTDDGKWQFNLKTKNYTAVGIYTILMVSGDDAEYSIDPTCAVDFEIE